MFPVDCSRLFSCLTNIILLGKSSKVRKTLPDSSKEPPKKVKKGSGDKVETDITSPELEISEHFDDSDYYLPYGGGYSVLDKKMRNYRSLLIERYHNAHQATLLNVK